MDQEAILQYVTETFAGLEILTADGTNYLFYDPDRDLPPERRLPFATIVTSDAHDAFSSLDRPSVFRLNIGVSKETFHGLFGDVTFSGDDFGAASGYDFTALDQIMPHPVYGKMFWLCVLNPSATAFEAIRPLLAEAYQRGVSQHARLRRGSATPPR